MGLHHHGHINNKYNIHLNNTFPNLGWMELQVNKYSQRASNQLGHYAAFLSEGREA